MSLRKMVERVAAAQHRFEQAQLLVLEARLSEARLGMSDERLSPHQQEQVLDLIRAHWVREKEQVWEHVLRMLEDGMELTTITIPSAEPQGGVIQATRH